ncbi:hypothetical protein KGF57_005185 [Candida theae]|uniref:Uncharacterized protein n=1 Tax=Candida theae TaxID=1198502 RepID=A0AAD5B9D3_9ASCO|nr:uncharacterized protein KGF57_005185 [Candida theae]KAI5948787.1 hypothetical protein KGF57_005185 [Candida theae]
MPPPSSPSESSTENRGQNHQQQEQQQARTSQRRFRNASNDFPTLNSLNVVSDLMLRDNSSRSETNEENLFRARILSHFNDIHRLQNHFNRLVNRDGSHTSLTLNNIPSQLRNFSRELSRSRRREAYLVETSGEDEDEDDQSFHYDDAGLVYYSDEDINNEDEMSENDEEALESLMEGTTFVPNERLLLTTARSPQENRPTSVPLRRQNAIRIRSMLNEEDGLGAAKHQVPKAYTQLDTEAKLLQREIHLVLETMSSKRKSSPLFPTDIHNPFSIRYFASLKNHMQGSSLDGNKNADQMMDEFLWKRIHKMLFLERALPAPPVSKKRAKSEKGPSYKRQKTNQVESKAGDLSIPSYPYLGIDKSVLVDGLQSSYFQSGSNYHVSLGCSEPNSCDMKVVSVTSGVEGVFNLEPEGNLESLLLKMHNFAKFFCGMSNNSYQLPQNKILIRKLNVLDRISVDDNVCFKKLQVNAVHIPFEGRVVDFRNNDLRFLSSERPLSARFSSNKVKVQLCEWMKINPFVQFRETFFYNFLQHLDQDLAKFPDIQIRKSKKTEALHLTREFKSNLPEITKYFAPASEKVDKRRSRRHNDIFVEDWERNLSLKLAEIVTREDCHTLINLQLNYALFTLEVDISKYLDTFINTILDHGEGKYIDNYRKVYNNILKDETENTKANLLCSVNKKTGKLEIHNTFSHLHYRHAARYSTGIILTTNPFLNENTGRNTYVYDDFDLFEEEPAPVNSDTFNKRFFENEPEHVVDKLTGYATSNLPVFDTV